MASEAIVSQAREELRKFYEGYDKRTTKKVIEKREGELVEGETALMLALGFKALKDRKQRKRGIASIKMVLKDIKNRDNPRRNVFFEVKEKYEDPITKTLTAQVSLVDLKKFFEKAEELGPIEDQKWTTDRRKNKRRFLKSKVRKFRKDLWETYSKKRKK